MYQYNVEAPFKRIAIDVTRQLPHGAIKGTDTS
jgi:hypothetical protein